MAWYTTTDNPAPHSWAESAKIRAEFLRIETSFGNLPALADNADKIIVVNTGETRLDAVTIAEAGMLDSVVAGSGLSGGGTSGDITINLDLSDLTAATSIANANTLAFYDGTATKKITLTNLRTGLDIPNVTGGVGLSGSGNSGTVTINLDLGSLTAATTIASTDTIAFHNGTDPKKITFAKFKTALNITDNSDKISTLVAGDGISGGGSSGSVTIGLDLSELTLATTLDVTNDTVPFTDVSNSNANAKITVANLRTQMGLYAYTWGDGLSASSNTVSLNINELTEVTTLASTDEFMIADTSDSNKVKKVSQSTFKTALSLPTPIEGVTAGDGLSGGGSSGSVTLSLDIDSLGTSSTTIDSSDLIAFSDESETGDPTKKITFSNFKKAMDIADYTASTGIDISATNVISLDIDDLTTATDIATSDTIPFVQTSKNKKPQAKITFANLKTALSIPGTPETYTAGTGIDLSSNTFSLDIDGLTATTSISDDDEIPIYDSSNAGNRKITFEKFKDSLPVIGAGTGVDISSNKFTIDLSELPTVTSVSSTDFVAVIDGTNSRKITVANLTTQIKALV